MRKSLEGLRGESLVRAIATIVRCEVYSQCRGYIYPARGTRRGDCRFPPCFETPRNQVQQRLDAQALFQKLDHLFEAESGLFASDGQLSDCRNQRRLFHFAAPQIFQRIAPASRTVRDLDHERL